MNPRAYEAVRRNPAGAGIGTRHRGWVRLTGQDRHSFLNGQVTNDIAFLQPGCGVHACLLNNTGHMLADLYVHACVDGLLVEMIPARADTVAKTLGRFIIRERVLIEDVSHQWATVTLQGSGARDILALAIGRELPLSTVMPLSNAPIALAGGAMGLLIEHTHTTARGGLDLMIPVDAAEDLLRALLDVSGAVELDSETAHVLRVEAGLPIWGSELDETVIPLEANLLSAINQNKGCYMGQEVIARIVSRGHTNRSLVGFRLSAPIEAGLHLQAEEGPRRNQDPARITSFALSPEAGPIALGYARSEYCELGTKLHSDDTGVDATVTALPFVA